MSGFKITNLKNLKAALQSKPEHSDPSSSSSIESGTGTDKRQLSSIPSVPFLSYLDNRSDRIPLSSSTIPTIYQQIENSGFGLSLQQSISEGRYLSARQNFAPFDIVHIETPFAWFDYSVVQNDDHKLIDCLRCNPSMEKEEIIHRFAQLEPVYSRYSGQPTETANTSGLPSLFIHPLQLISAPIHMNAFQTRTYVIPETFHTTHSYDTLGNLAIFLRHVIHSGTTKDTIPLHTTKNNFETTLPLQLCTSISSMFNHSCVPNITYISIILQSSSASLSTETTGASSSSSHSIKLSSPLPYNIPILIFYAIKNIDKNDTLYHSYIDPDAHVDDRHIRLSQGYSFTCQCSKCTQEKNSK